MRQLRSNRIFGGSLLILVAAGGYVVMHVFFFGIPQFTLGTAIGRSEIAYTLANLVLAGIGGHTIYQGSKERHKGES